jgi:hypothetical protein
MLNDLLGELSLEAQVRVVMNDPLGALLGRAGVALTQQRDEIKRLRSALRSAHEVLSEFKDCGDVPDALEKIETALTPNARS